MEMQLMGFAHASTLILSTGLGPGRLPGLLTGQGVAGAGQAFLWIAVALAIAGTVLSACCLAARLAAKRRDPYWFMGQWFIWLATPLLWGLVAASFVLAWLKPVDLAAVLAVVAISRRGAQAICDRTWARQRWRAPGFILPGQPTTLSR